MEYFLVLAGLVGLFFGGDWLVRGAYGLTFAAWRVRAAEWGRLFDGLCELHSGHVLKKAAPGEERPYGWVSDNQSANDKDVFVDEVILRKSDCRA